MTNYVVITGASHGIGKATAALFLEQGWHVINLSRTPCVISGVKNIEADLSDDDWSTPCADVLASELQQAEKIVLVHNAAAFEADNVQTVSAADLRRVMNVNVLASIMLNQLVLPHMKPGSAIIYIGTTLAEQAVPGRASYVISKHAVVGLMRATTQDLAGQGIHTCCICPGFVNTKMIAGVPKDRLNALIEAKVTAKRLIEPDEIADFVYYCADHPIVNGAVLHVNLGQVMS